MREYDPETLAAWQDAGLIDAPPEDDTTIRDALQREFDAWKARRHVPVEEASNA